MSEVRYARRGLVPMALGACASLLMVVGCAGEAGQNGTNGTNCTVTKSGGTTKIECQDGTNATVTDGTPGQPGNPGDPGTPGNPGTNAVDTGTISGMVKDATTGAGIVAHIEDIAWSDVKTDSAADGTFTLTPKVGVYTLKITANGYTALTLPAVGVAGGKTSTVSASLAATTPVSPIKVAGTNLYQVGFGKPVTLTAPTITGASAAATYAWTCTGPTTVTLTGGTTLTPSFTTGSIDAVLASPKLGGWNTGDNFPMYFRRAERAEWLAVTSTQNDSMAYTCKLTVTDGTVVPGTGSVLVYPATWTSSLTRHPVGVTAIANDKTATSYTWTLSAKPTGSAATLNDADKRNPWFIPDVAGDYTLTNSAPTTPTTLTLKAAAWSTGWNSTNCQLCHGDSTSAAGIATADESANWANTGHANLFKEGVSGIAEPGHYSGSCVKCHTLGYDVAVANGGFDEKGFTFPATASQAAYDGLDPAIKNMGSIQCENCHGPATNHSSATNMPKPNLAASTCGYCHDGKSHHDLYYMWSQSGHADITTAMAETSNTNHCGRCHFAQGYLEYVKQLKLGYAGQMVGTTLTSLGVTADSPAESVTCAVCHEPHSDKLRLEVAPGTTMMLAGGFGIPGEVGKGALCITCHNTRNGTSGSGTAVTYWLHDDGAPASKLTSLSAPHQAGQGDVFMGRNAFFMGTAGQISHHAAIEDTCVHCHMMGTGFSETHMNHTFKADRATCAECHGEGVTGEGMKGAYEANVAALAAKIGQKVASLMTGIYSVTPWFPTADVDPTYGPATTPTNADQYTAAAFGLTEAPTSVSLVEIHGQVSFKAVFPTTKTITFPNGPVTTNTIYFQSGSLKNVSNVALITPTSDLFKACWNYYLVEADGSFGVHNPSFTDAVFTNTMAKLNALP